VTETALLIDPARAAEVLARPMTADRLDGWLAGAGKQSRR
jgi:hypothetical protein